MARRRGCLHVAELLEWSETGSGIAEDCETAEARRLRVPAMQFQTSVGSFLEVQQLPAGV